MKYSAPTLAALVASALLVAGPANAAVVDEMTVTSQKREQSASDVPIAITAVTSEMLRTNVVRDVFDLRATIPALEIRAVDPPGQGTSFAIRGLGTSVFNMGFEPSVGTFVDGVYRSRSGLVASNDLYDIERVEVLKGPQGTLFGKNTTAGVVHFLTKAPDFDGVTGEVQASYEEYNRTRVNAYLNAPLSDTVSTRLTVTYADGDGWLDDLANGREVQDLDRFSLRGQILWNINEDLDLRIVADYAEVDEQCCWPLRFSNDARTSAANLAVAESIGSTVIDPASIENLNVAINGTLNYKAEDSGVMAELNWDIGLFKFTSVTGYRDYNDSNSKDNDFTGVDVLTSNQNLPEIKLFSQELRLTGTLNDKFTWIVGGYYADEDIKRSNEFIWGSQIGDFPSALSFPGAAPGLFGNAPGRAFFAEFEQNTETIAGFVHGEWQFAPKWRVTGGLRYTNDDKTARSRNDQPQALPLPIVFDFEAKTDDSEPTGTLALQWDPNDEVMVFAQYSRGFKSGGISLNRDAAGANVILGNPVTGCPPGFMPSGPVCLGTEQDPTFKKETADHFELGVKSFLFDNQVSLNASVFFTKFDDLQLQTLRPDGSFAVENAAEAEAPGVEIEGQWAATDNLTINAALLYLDAQFGDNIGIIDPSRPDPSGKRLPFSSEWTGQIGAIYDRPDTFGQWDWFASGNLFARSEQFLDPLPDDDRVQDSYSLVNLRTGLRTPGEMWEFAVWCRNCFDERYKQSQFAIPFDGLILGSATEWSHVGAPRIFGGTVTFNFGR